MASCLTLYLLLLGLCACSAVPDFSEHVKYGLTDYPGAAEGESAYDYLCSVATPEAATESGLRPSSGAAYYFFSHARTKELLKDVQILDLDKTDNYFCLERYPESNEIILNYGCLGGQAVAVTYYEDGNFMKVVRTTPFGARHPKLVIFESRDKSVTILEP